MAVGQHQGLHVVQAVFDQMQSRQNQVDAGVVVRGKQHAAVDQQQLAVDLEAGAVASDVAETTQRNHAKGVCGQLGGCLEQVTHPFTLVLSGRPT